MRKKELIDRWKNLIYEKLKGDVETAVVNGDTLKIDYWLINRVDIELGDALLNEPENAIFSLKDALVQIDREYKNLEIEIINKNDDHPVNLTKIEDIRVRDINKLLTIDGFITEATDVRPYLVRAAFQCRKCGAIIYKEMYDDHFEYPNECYEDQGGCDRSTSFDFLENKSTYRNFQRMEIQDLYQQTRIGTIECECFDSLAGRAFPGETICVLGIPCIRRSGKNLTMNQYIRSLGIKHQSQDKNLELTREERKRVKELAQDSKLFSRLIDSFAPSILRYHEIKEAIILQVFNGIWHCLPDRTTRRGSIHILMVGDPGTIKSTLMRAAQKIAPRCRYTSGRGASAPGLTASAVKDKLGEKGWTLKAGALVLANDGLCIIDEFDKLPPDARGELHTPMEQGFVTISKAGINQELPARTSILASMNPRYGRFDVYAGKIIDQIGLDDPPLLSRFDLIFGIMDTPDKTKDYQIAQHMGNAIRGDISEPEFEPSFLRKYIYYAKSIEPTIPSEINDLITQEYVRWRETEDIHINPRHVDSIRRMCEASARIRLSGIVSKEDLDRAWRIFQHSMESLDIHDLDEISTKLATKLRRIYLSIREILPTTWNDLIGKGYKEEDIRSLIARGFLKEKDGKIYDMKRENVTT